MLCTVHMCESDVHRFSSGASLIYSVIVSCHSLSLSLSLRHAYIGFKRLLTFNCQISFMICRNRIFYAFSTIHHSHRATVSKDKLKESTRVQWCKTEVDFAFCCQTCEYAATPHDSQSFNDQATHTHIMHSPSPD